MSRLVASDAAAEPSGLDAVATVDALLQEATALGASDLHLDPGVDRCRLRLRRDGKLEDWRELSLEQAQQVVGRLKSLAQLLVYRSDLPQEGAIVAGEIEGCRELRVASYPAANGERVALRLGEPAHRGFDELGLPGEVAQDLRGVLHARDGVVLLTGPSGSGKTTTLYACLAELLQAEGAPSIVSIEDPIERRVDGVVQTELNPQSGLDGATALRSLLRQDPDVLMVGEIRDPETAALVFEAGLTGHLVLATLHAGSPLQVIARLRGFGVEAFTLGTSLRGVLSQRLVARRPSVTCARSLSSSAMRTGANCRSIGSRSRASSSRLSSEARVSIESPRSPHVHEQILALGRHRPVSRPATKGMTGKEKRSDFDRQQSASGFASASRRTRRRQPGPRTPSRRRLRRPRGLSSSSRAALPA